MFLFQQWRLMPILSAAYVMDVFAHDLFIIFVKFQVSLMMGEPMDNMVS